MSFHITITDNETGATCVDVDAKAFLGGYAGEEHSSSILLAKCNGLDLAKAVYAAELAAEHMKSQKSAFFRFLCAEVAANSENTVIDKNSETEE